MEGGLQRPFLRVLLVLSSGPAYAEWVKIGGGIALLQYATCEASMAFTLRLYQRFPVYCPVTYQTGSLEGHGTVWNVSLTGWRFSGNLPLRVGEVCSLTVYLPDQPCLYVAAGIVRWVRGQQYGVETHVMDDESREDTEQYICQQVEDKWIGLPAWRTVRPRNQEMDRDC